MDAGALEYVGFWPRVLASLIDTVLVCLVTVPLSLWIYGAAYWTSPKIIKGPADFVISWLLPALAILGCWAYWQATPGKMAISARIVDASTGGIPTAGQYIGRYLAYFLATLPLCLGLIWVAFDPRKQGWHDKLANTVVVRPRLRGPKSVEFGEGRGN